jgi:uncharacterized membrane protein YgcG
MSSTTTMRTIGWWLSTAVVVACASCASSSYRIPAAEMQRLAQLNVAERGALVRVMPPDQSSQAFAAIPDAPPPEQTPASVPPMAAPPADGPMVEEDVVVVDEGPSWSGGGNVAIDVGPAARPVPRMPDHRVPTVHSTGAPRLGGSSSFSPPVVTPVIRAAPIGGGGPGIMRAGVGGGMARAPSAARLPAPGAMRVSGGHGGSGHSGGGHSGGSFSGGDALAVVVAAVIVIGLIAVIAEAASEEPPPFDGWAAIPPDHPIHLRYAQQVERTIKLRDLRPQDLVGLKDTIVKDSDGKLRRLPPDADQRLARRESTALMNASPRQ